MNIVSDEVISVSAGTTFTLTRSKIDNDSGPRTRGAIIHNHELGTTESPTDSVVGIRVGTTAPVEASFTFLPINPGDDFTLEGYENLCDLQIILTGSTTAKLFVQYFA